MANLQSDIPLSNAPMVDARGQITEAWFIFLLQLWRRSGGGVPPPETITIGDVLALEQVFTPFSDSDKGNGLATELTFALAASSNYTQSAQSVTLGASPAVYTATYPQGFYISGGTVTALVLQRGAVALPIGNSSSDMVDSTPAFTPGVSTAVTLPNSFGAISRLWVFFDGVFQGDDQIASLVGTTLTFTAAIPVGVTKVYVKGLLQSAIGTGSTLVELSPGDTVHVTYTGSPSVTILAR